MGNREKRIENNTTWKETNRNRGDSIKERERKA